MDERVSYFLLFFALLASAQGQGSIQKVMRLLPVNEKARKLAGALAS